MLHRAAGQLALPSLRPPRGGRRAAARRAGRWRSPGTARGPRASRRSCARRSASELPGVPARRRCRRRQGPSGPHARGIRGGVRRRARRHPDGRQGPRLRRRRARRRPRRRPDAPVPGLPGRGADVRARHAARRPGRPRRGLGPTPPAGCWCRRWRRRPRSLAFAARHDSDGFLEQELGRRRALGYPAVRVADPDRVLGRRGAGGARGGNPPARSDRARGRGRARAGAAVQAARPVAQPARDQVLATGRPRCAPSGPRSTTASPMPGGAGSASASTSTRNE